MTDAPASYRNREEWLKERQSGIGGSDAAAVLGVNPFMTPLELWESKVQEVAQVEPTGPMLRGIHLEPVAADLYVEQTGRQVRRQPLRRHSEHKHMIANVDRQILATTEDVTSTGVLEVKCPGLRVMAKVKARGLEDYMTVQLMHYLAVLGYTWGSFALFNAENWQLIHFDLEADLDFIDMLVEKEAEFWTKYVQAGTPPPADQEPWADVPKVEGELKVVDGPMWREFAGQLLEAQALKRAALDLEGQAKEQLQALMQDVGAEAVEIAEFARLYWKEQAGRAQWKKVAEALAKAASLDVNDYMVVGKPSRPFRPYFLKQEVE